MLQVRRLNIYLLLAFEKSKSNTHSVRWIGFLGSEIIQMTQCHLDFLSRFGTGFKNWTVLLLFLQHPSGLSREMRFWHRVEVGIPGQNMQGTSCTRLGKLLYSFGQKSGSLAPAEKELRKPPVSLRSLSEGAEATACIELYLLRRNLRKARAGAEEECRTACAAHENRSLKDPQ